jgi:Zn finger protein HypA/HybF involved in hydrogenase expression
MPIKSCIWDISDKDFIKIVKESIFYSEVAIKVGYKNGSTNTVIKKRINKLELDVSHFKKGHHVTNKSFKKTPLKDICVKNSTYSRGWLKERLFKELKWEHKCNYCSNKEWKHIMTDKIEPIPLQLDHINGDNKDHRLENLRLLCPTCHANTDTYAGRNVKHIKIKNKCVDCESKIHKRSTRCNSCSSKNNRISNRKVKIRPTLEQLEKDLETMPMTKVGKKYGVSDNSIRKWIRNYRKC